MKCPKCDYLGFDTGDRCKNCGYDFSLIPTLAEVSEFDADLTLRPIDDAAQGSPKWDGALASTRGTEPTSSSALSHFHGEKKLPLFSPGPDESDEPLIKLPAVPRAPLAVRRTPDTPRLRAVPKRARSFEGEPALEFNDEASSDPGPAVALIADVRVRTNARLASRAESLDVSGAGPRLAAVVIDHLLLIAIDVTVIYFTVRMAELPMSDWSELPLVPLVAFLMLLKLSYFCVFTAVGGQTIGKMAARIRVVTAEDGPLDAAAAVARSLAGALSVASLGLGYVPALLGPDHRAVHDRLTRTHVVAVPPA